MRKTNIPIGGKNSYLITSDEASLRETPKRERSKDSRRQRIVAAARELMTEEGLSMRPLAKRAKVASTTPYNLFGSKNAIVAAVMMEDLRWFR